MAVHMLLFLDSLLALHRGVSWHGVLERLITAGRQLGWLVSRAGGGRLLTIKACSTACTETVAWLGEPSVAHADVQEVVVDSSSHGARERVELPWCSDANLQAAECRW